MATEYGEDHLDFRGAKFGSFTAKRVEYRERGPAPTALDALPARAVGFTGREDELRSLLAALDPTAPGIPAAVLVAAVSGLGGIGKTSLAVEAGYGACAKRWFPGGTLFVDLHGYDEDPVTADQALQALLRALGVEPEHIPATADERAALYRSTLARRASECGPVLILADNASSSAQVRPLLPGDGARHRLLVTSRDVLPQLGARLVRLDQLAPEEAYELLDRALRIADPSDSRVVDDAESAAALAERCGHLPLALQIAAAQLVAERDRPVVELLAEFGAARDRLDHLDDGERSVRAAFDLSYRRLPPDQARVLRLLALAPGPDASDEVVAALVGEDAAPVAQLNALARAHLVERGSGRRRWRLHDLVRVYGAAVVAGDAGLAEEGAAARERVLGFYWERAYAADRWLRWLPDELPPTLFADRREALGWLDGERAALVAAVQWTDAERFASAAVGLAGSLGAYLEWRRYFDDWISVGRAACEAARRVGDGRGEAGGWTSLGIALRETGRSAEAIDALTRGRDLCHDLGERNGEARAWTCLGNALYGAGRVEEAIDAHRRARDLYQDIGNRRDEGAAWNNLGIALRNAERVEEAIDAHTRACELYRAVGDRLREGMALGNLGIALRKAGQLEEAIEAYDKDLEICREFEDWYGTGQTFYNLALAHQAADRPADARAAWLQSADAYTQANAPAEAAEALSHARATDSPPPPTP
jgi:tetratricopeptide (TPR) repeat protein